jgi:hypothetical protein
LDDLLKPHRIDICNRDDDFLNIEIINEFGNRQYRAIYLIPRHDASDFVWIIVNESNGNVHQLGVRTNFIEYEFPPCACTDQQSPLTADLNSFDEKDAQESLEQTRKGKDDGFDHGREYIIDHRDKNDFVKYQEKNHGYTIG